MSGRFGMLLWLLVLAALCFTGTPAYAQNFTCSSDNNQYRMCQIPGNANPQNVRMVKQLSQVPCVQGRTWGTRRNQVWVDKGCRAEFQVAGYGGPGYGGPGYGGGYQGGPPRGGPPAYYSGSFSDGRSNCTSGPGSGPVYCQSGGAFKYANPVRVNNACVQNRTWGVSQYGLWVANGCSGQWEIKR
jgi:hypothetical protein